MNMKWRISNCKSNRSSPIRINEIVITILSELYIPSRTLNIGIYELKSSVTMAILSNLTSSVSAFVKINPAGIIVNLIQVDISMITNGLRLCPGAFTINLNGNLFNASNWIYEYYCRLNDLYDFPQMNGSLLAIGDERIDPFNLSCISNRSDNGTLWQYDNSSKSSLTVFAGSLQSNRTSV